MTLRFQAPEGHIAVTFGAGCNVQREVVDGLLDCPLGERCTCHELALQAGWKPIEQAEKVAVIRAADTPKPRRRRTRKPKA